MDKYLIRVSRDSPQLTQNPNPRQRRQWKRILIELEGRSNPKYCHQFSSLLIESYSEVGAFPHLYRVDGFPCLTHLNRIGGAANTDDLQSPITKQGISALELDNKGVYLVSVTKSGCLTVHDFDNVDCITKNPLPCAPEEENKQVLHLSLGQQLDAVRWNPLNQDEVACASMKSNEVRIFDIGYISSETIQVLRLRRNLTIHGSEIRKGVTDITFSTIDKSRLVASDTYGVISIWDRRMSNLPCIELTTNSRSSLNSIQLNVENQMVFGAGRQGIVYVWDLRGGRASATFQSHKEVCYPPIMSCKIASLLERIGSLKAQAGIASKEVHAINFNPSCPYQLAFHLDDGWSGILDIFNFQVTHVHCPPPAWLDGPDISADMLCLRKPSWLRTHSIYAVGSSSNNGIHLLDFYPDRSSPCHVDYSEDGPQDSSATNQNVRNRFLPLSEGVTACTTHPLTDTIVAGTKNSTLLVVSQLK